MKRDNTFKITTTENEVYYTSYYLNLDELLENVYATNGFIRIDGNKIIEANHIRKIERMK